MIKIDYFVLNGIENFSLLTSHFSLFRRGDRLVNSE
jgi:hypothetical protein